MRLTIVYYEIKKRNLVLVNNATYQRETLSGRPIRQPLRHHGRFSDRGVLMTCTPSFSVKVDDNTLVTTVNKLIPQVKRLRASLTTVRKKISPRISPPMFYCFTKMPVGYFGYEGVTTQNKIIV